ncbi:recombinase family protein [Streptomyces rubellomurinus]|uniref:recombinase family protein n=1 Tax=Streptomyces rubellomurinus (strain ATCC 31215) TaxID=359131 RepID=UPI000AA50586|nr:recombinase family protein [Streptomyces rubellomurinus]
MHIPTPPESLHAPRVEVVTDRLQVVIYLARNGSTFPEREMRSCESYALAFRWNVSLIVVDDSIHTTAPERRPMLQAALHRVRSRDADAILVPARSAISPIVGEFDEFSRQVEKAGGFVQVATR